MPEIDFTKLSLMTFVLVYFSGVAASLTPCVYPMIPIVVGYLGGQTGSWKLRLRAALLYVAGSSLVYAGLGVIAAATGRMFGEMTTSPWLYIAFGVLILLLGGSMMDWYELPLPRFLQPKASGEKRSSSPWHALLVGASSGLVASPCTAPVMGGLLFFVASQGKYGAGALLMLTFSLGMNTLLLALGFSAGALRNLPRSGVWMVNVKKALAFILIGSGLYFVYRAGQIS